MDGLFGIILREAVKRKLAIIIGTVRDFEISCVPLDLTPMTGSPLAREIGQ